jgi:hypothetical protein
MGFSRQSLFDMKSRPSGVTLIAVVFCLMGIYLFGLGLVMLTPLRPPLLAAIISLAHRLRPLSPYVALGIGSAWIILGWGLFRLHDWARVVAMTLVFVGVGLELVRLALGPSHPYSTLAGGALEISLRLVIVWYLFRKATAERFLKSTKST